MNAVFPLPADPVPLPAFIKFYPFQRGPAWGSRAKHGRKVGHVEAPAVEDEQMDGRFSRSAYGMQDGYHDFNGNYHIY